MLEKLSSIANTLIEIFFPTGAPPENTQHRKIYSWSAFMGYLESLDLAKNWQKYEEQ
ncbi:MAG: hypothetical protein HYT75_02595, partial [Deltaproteobacteria bacterium]|nr:hypothetical protein [Deltaproteobacteria bacterium]